MIDDQELMERAHAELIEETDTHRHGCLDAPVS